MEEIKIELPRFSSSEAKEPCIEIDNYPEMKDFGYASMDMIEAVIHVKAVIKILAIDGLNPLEFIINLGAFGSFSFVRKEFHLGLNNEDESMYEGFEVWVYHWTTNEESLRFFQKDELTKILDFDVTNPRSLDFKTIALDFFSTKEYNAISRPLKVHYEEYTIYEAFLMAKTIRWKQMPGVGLLTRKHLIAFFEQYGLTLKI